MPTAIQTTGLPTIDALLAEPTHQTVAGTTAVTPSRRRDVLPQGEPDDAPDELEENDDYEVLEDEDEDVFEEPEEEPEEEDLDSRLRSRRATRVREAEAAAAREQEARLLRVKRAFQGDAAAIAQVQTDAESARLYRTVYDQDPPREAQAVASPTQNPLTSLSSVKLKESFDEHDRLLAMKRDDSYSFELQTRDQDWAFFWAGMLGLKQRYGLAADATSAEMRAAIALAHETEASARTSRQLSAFSPEGTYLEFLSNPDAKRVFTEADWQALHPSKFAGKTDAEANAEMNRVFGARLARRAARAGIQPALDTASAAARTARAAAGRGRDLPTPTGNAPRAVSDTDIVGAYTASRRPGGRKSDRVDAQMARFMQRMGA